MYFRAVRTGSWLGWLFNFGLGCVLLALPPAGRALLLAVAFALATSSVFVLNQYFDREADRENEAKATLPVASGEMTPRGALFFSLSLASLSLSLVWAVDASLLPLFLVYLGLWTAYSAPAPHLKSLPVLDFVASGVGAGLLPFVMGLEVTHQLTPYPFGLSHHWVRRRYCDALLTAAPLTLFQSGSHIIQAVGDCEADRGAGLRTLPARYGRRAGVALAGSMFLAAVLSPLAYMALGLSSRGYLPWYSVALPFAAPALALYRKVLMNPSEGTVANLRKLAVRYGPPTLAAAWIYVLLLRAVL